jgi:hypothetical protein
LGGSADIIEVLGDILARYIKEKWGVVKYLSYNLTRCFNCPDSYYAKGDYDA